MVDLVARAKVRSAVDDYLSDRITSFAFDERLWEIETDDETVRYVSHLLWFTYDDMSDHPVRLDKQSWNTIQRLLLLLDSAAEFRSHRQRVWHVSQVAAAVTFCSICYLFWNYPQGWFVPFLIGGAISVGLGTWRANVRAAQIPAEPTDPWHAWPFPSLSAIRRAMAIAPSFSKRKFRPEIIERYPRSRLERLGALNISLPRFIEWPLSRLGWCVMSPVILLAQCLPIFAAWRVFAETERKAG